MKAGIKHEKKCFSIFNVFFYCDTVVDKKRHKFILFAVYKLPSRNSYILDLFFDILNSYFKKNVFLYRRYNITTTTTNP